MQCSRICCSAVLWLLFISCGHSTEPDSPRGSNSASAADGSLIAAIKKRARPSAIAELIRQDIDVNQSQGDGTTALHWAVHRNQLGAAKLLINAGANVATPNEFGVCPLSLACTNGNSRMIETLLDAGADPDAALLTGETPLMTAARSGGLGAVSILLKYGAKVNVAEPIRKQTALMWALSEKHPNVARRLIVHGAKVNASTTLGFTPLHFAVREGDFKSAEMLLNSGADVNAVTKDQLSVLHVATLRGHTKLAVMLLERGADASAIGPGYSPLHWAVGKWETELNGTNGITAPVDHEWDKMRGVQAGKLELVKALLVHGADPNARLSRNPPRYGFTTLSTRPVGATPFALAAMAGDTVLMRLLVEHGADPHLKAENGATPLMMAAGIRRNRAENVVAENDSLAAVKLALELGTDVNAKDIAGNTALHGAARIKSAKIIQLLVDHGAEINVVNELGQSPLFMATHFWHASRNEAEDEPSAAGELLRKLTLPEDVAKAMDEWASLSQYVRDEITFLLQAQMLNLDELIERREHNPMFRLDGSRLEPLDK